MSGSTRIVLVTGTSSGIGEAIVKSFTKHPNIKVYASARNLASIKKLESNNVSIVQLDVCDKSSIKNAVDFIIKKEGRIDILVNNAGMNIYSPVIEMTEEEGRRLMDTNFFGAIEVTKEVGMHMIKRRSGLIANIGSIVALVSTPFAGMYCASKAALHAWSDSLRMEMAPFNVQVSIVMPGAIKSDLVKNAQDPLTDLLNRTIYHQIKDEIIKRSNSSQDNAIPAEDFSDYAVNQILKPNPPARFAYGPLSTLLKILHYLPCWIPDFLFSKKFGLAKLKSIISNESTSTDKSKSDKIE
ncbi:glucose/ribitol dehydrogenase family protein [Heterostelium album PN500]|uniref:Glucose/ribitol dehydrogenase family protein n=1 Tax=Heterostelium pallidum (strain ATCC 26659 / Pp 5 / PN500) TaxID=670386 RepID=D3BQQ1_HETP5|nr:glucose/ribitol dehydrogenase family protein [Heterostelium album PN500]EFA76471.1 glucose/ribitol dehydrogenase family protein [Heterostelium album PN500]|eukprot:XP_020428603.1 glucose/ribitol dehydrogenase family protein [Heterostelium album PN500]